MKNLKIREEENTPPRPMRRTNPKCLIFDSSSNDSKYKDDKSICGDSEESVVYGPTTRRAWSVWCNNKRSDESKLRHSNIWLPVKSIGYPVQNAQISEA